MHEPVTTALAELLHTQGDQVLVHGIAVDKPSSVLHIVVKWCSAYWVDSNPGQISGPWTTLEAALRHTPAGTLCAGELHTIVCPDHEPEAIASMMVLVGDGAPREVTINGEEWLE